MRQISWVVAYIDSAEETQRGWPRPLKKPPEIFEILRRADERVLVWELSDLDADLLAEELRDAATVVFVVPVPTARTGAVGLFTRGAHAYELLQDSWRYQLQYLDPGTERRLGAEWGLAEAAYEGAAGPISLLEHRYILEGLHDLTAGLKDVPKKQHWERNAEGRYRPETVASTVLDRMVRADEVNLRSSLRREIVGGELSYDELLALPSFLTLGLFEQLADVVRENREARYNEIIARRTVEVLTTLTEEELASVVQAFGRVADASLLATVVAKLTDEPEIYHLMHSLKTATAESSALRRHDELRRRQFARYVTVARLLARLDWIRFLEEVDPVYGELRRDPAGVYGGMTAETRQRYRLEIATLAHWLGTTDLGVAEAATKASKGEHIGVVLLGSRRAAFERQLKVNLPLSMRIVRLYQNHAATGYLLSIAVAVVFVVSLVVLATSMAGLGIGLTLVLCLLGVQPAIEMVNFYLTRLIPPRFLPELDIRTANEVGSPLVIAVPTMLTGDTSGDIRRLELRFLANRIPGTAFGLLTDLVDAPSAEREGDAERLKAVVDGISDLQQRYPEGRFFIFHRPRAYTKGEQAWIGRERKRGKIEDFVALLVKGDHREYLVEGDYEWLAGAKYMISLDADTTLPPGTASRLFGAIAHPLNAHFGIVQPHVTTGYESATANGMTRLYHNQPGVDPYLRGFSDIYYDLSGDAIYHGKGVINVDHFYDKLHDRLPDERVLSHDLLEGSYVGVALAADIVLYDDFPTTLSAIQTRDQRWARGDWQLTAWLSRRVPNGQGLEPNPLSALGRFKIWDNLRRSLVDPLTLLVLISAAVARQLAPALVIVVVFRALPLILSAPRSRDFGRAIWLSFTARGYELSVLPYRALHLMDAITRAIWRSFVSHRHLLQWRTAAHAASTSHTGFDGWFAGQITVALTIVAFDRTAASLILLGIWSIGIVVTYWLERPRALPASPISDSDRRYLRRLAVQTWQYFDEFMNQNNNYLPPDNFQVAFKNRLASRTSPTNIGLGLMVWMEAVEFGFTTMTSSLDRLGPATATLDGLERYRGHLYNWYDVTTLQPVGPHFVSTVDSGNLVMSLWALSGGLKQWSTRPLLGYSNAEGLRDILDELHGSNRDWPETLYQELSTAIEALFGEITAVGYVGRLASVIRLISARKTTLEEVVGETSPALQRFLKTSRDLDHEITTYLGWFVQLAEIAAGSRQLPGEFKELLLATVGEVPSLAELIDDTWQTRLVDLSSFASDNPNWGSVIEQYSAARSHAAHLSQRMNDLNTTIRRFSDDTDFTYLYNPTRRTFHIGYDADNDVLDRSFYDLLASEARTASFVAVASGQVPARHWWALGRNMRVMAGRTALLSWSGTMFEYLMPRLFLRSYEGTLLDTALLQAVAIQQSQGSVLGVPWGISESGHSDLDADDTYQYHAYGVQSLAVQAVPEQGTVVAPYASCMALMVDPQAALSNLRDLDRFGMRGRYGFYEAIDYRRPYRPSGERGLIVYSYMAHHQGMTFLALSNVLNNDAVVRRVESDARVAAASPLLQERPARVIRPKVPVLLPVVHPLRPIQPILVADGLADLAKPIPSQHLFSNGRLTTTITARGSGNLRWNGIELNRWQADPLLEQGGLKLYLRDADNGSMWRLGSSDSAKVRVESLPEALAFESSRDGLRSRLEVMVAPDADVEIRYIKLVNNESRERTVELTSLFEFGLAEHAAQRAHPAFNQFFINTEALPEYDAVIGQRRHRSNVEKPVFVAHLMVNLSHPSRRAELGNNRNAFIGRVGSTAAPAGLNSPLTVGPSIDPAAIVRQNVALEPLGRVELAVLTIAADSRDEIIRLAERYRQASQIRRVRQSAWATAESELQRLQVSHAETELFQRLSGYLSFPNAYLKAGAAGLTAIGSSTTHLMPEPQPIVVVINNQTDLGLVRQLWLAAAFLGRRDHLLGVLVIIRSDSESLVELERALEALRGRMESLLGKDLPLLEVTWPNRLTHRDLIEIISGAKIVLDAKAGSLTDQLAAVPRLAPIRQTIVPKLEPIEPSRPSLPMAIGGFSKAGRSYRFDLDGQTTPAPWSNVISNPVFGTLVTERGSGFTWDGNSQQKRITPWRNDPVDDRPSEGWYVMEAASNEFWPVLPSPDEVPYLRVEHTLGRSIWTGRRSGLDFTVEVTVPQGDSRPRRVRLSTLSLTNTTSSPRKFIVSSFAELSLGRDLEQDWNAARSSWRRDRGVLLFRSLTSGLRDTVVYAALSSPVLDVTTSRAEVTGPVADGLPYGLSEATLSGRVGRDHRSVAALRSEISIAPGETIHITSYLGAAHNESEALRDVARLRDHDISQINQQVDEAWSGLTGTIRVRTPDATLDAMLNYWLIYQVVSSRLWGRTGYYQSSGAFGFRDQLQDVISLLYTRPDMARLQILTAANHQFVEGDVHHWWQPLTMWGLRTHFSDDRLWLPYVVARYVEVTGDASILSVEVPYIEGLLLPQDEPESYAEATVSSASGTILDHCLRAVAVSEPRGKHDLPFIGSGDWCDGYNRVGVGGTGETVWGAWFLAIVEEDLAKLVTLTGKTGAATLRKDAEALRQAGLKSWDGEWYRRGYYDDGQPLGSIENDEGQIDSLSQSWAVLAGLKSARERQAIDSAVERLVNEEAGIVRLLAPSFDKTELDPGYIRGYLPGVRENGGQYTHGSLWLAIATARLGQSARAHRLLSMMLAPWHGATPERQERYTIEPYVMAGDVYSLEGLEGRGGWSWYTGAAGVMYRAWIEEVLGLTIRADRLSLNPVIPSEWPGFELSYTYGSTVYELVVRNTRPADGVAKRLNGQPFEHSTVKLVDDGAPHRLEQWLG